nr:uncharacterized protein LOC109150784 [Ipomoea trifida]
MEAEMTDGGGGCAAQIWWLRGRRKWMVAAVEAKMDGGFGGEGKILNGNCNSVEVSNYGVEQGVSSTQPEKAWLPLRKLFTEECETQSSCSSSEADELDGVPVETYCIWRSKPVDDDQLFLERCKKRGAFSD